jgi:hypothetical protein
LRYRSELDEIFSGTAADGRYAQNDDDSLIDPSLLGNLGIESGPGSEVASQATLQIVEEEEEEKENIDLDPTEDEVVDLSESATQQEISTTSQSISTQLNSPSDHFLSQSTTKVIPLKRAASSSFQSSRSKRTVQDAFNRIATVFKSKMEGKLADNRPTAKTLALATLHPICSPDRKRPVGAP